MEKEEIIEALNDFLEDEGDSLEDYEAFLKDLGKDNIAISETIKKIMEHEAQHIQLLMEALNLLED